MTVDLKALTDEELDAMLEGIDEADLVEQTAADIEWMDAVRHDFPLSFEMLWRNAEAPWDQARAVEAFKPMISLVLVLGGNRSGKTYGMKQLAVAMALGGDHPAVMAWLADNNLPADLVPLGPGIVIFAAQSANGSVSYHRKDLDRLLPAEGTKWWNRQALTEARVEVEVPGYDEPAVIFCKSVDQGHRSYKGLEARFVVIDEEPEGTEGRLVLEECLRAVSSVGGWVAMSMTPQNGFTWVHDELVQEGRYSPVVVELDALHNTMVQDTDSLRRHLDSMSEDQREMRRFGRFMDLRGLVYLGFTPGDMDRWGIGHLCEPFEIPEDWPRFSAADFGLRAPTAVVWGALGDDDTLYIYRDYEVAGPSYFEHAIAVHELQGDAYREDGSVTEYGERIEQSWGDPGDTGKEAMQKWSQCDLYYGNATKHVREGIDEVKNRLRVHADDRPRLKVFTPCKALVKGFRGYRWSDKTKVPTPIKKDDHLMDALRYLCMGVREWLG